MNKTDNNLQEQEAPVKNTDNAFVKVGTDGQPQTPGGDSDGEADRDSAERLVPRHEPAK